MTVGIVASMPVTCEPHERLRPISVDECHRMIEVGILTEDDKVELLDGLIVAVPPEGPHHVDVIAELNWRIVRALPEDRSFRLRVGNPLTFRPRSEPEPDLAIVDHRPQRPSAVLRAGGGLPLPDFDVGELLSPE